jgi:hypothetical protein
MQHVHPADTLWDAQSHPTLARGLLRPRFLGWVPEALSSISTTLGLTARIAHAPRA